MTDNLPPIEWNPDVEPVVLSGQTKLYFVTENGALLRCFTNPNMSVTEGERA